MMTDIMTGAYIMTDMQTGADMMTDMMTGADMVNKQEALSTGALLEEYIHLPRVVVIATNLTSTFLVQS